MKIFGQILERKETKKKFRLVCALWAINIVCRFYSQSPGKAVQRVGLVVWSIQRVALISKSLMHTDETSPSASFKKILVEV